VKCKPVPDTIGTSPPQHADRSGECEICEGIGRVIVVHERSNNGSRGEFVALTPWSAMRERYYNSNISHEMRIFRCRCPAGAGHPDFPLLPKEIRPVEDAEDV